MRRALPLLLALSLFTAGAGWGQAPERSLFPRARPFGTTMSITDAAVAEALRAAERAEAARVQAEQDAAAQLAAQRASAEAAPGVVATSLIPRRRPATPARAPEPERPAAIVRTPAPAEGPSQPVARGLCGARGLAGRELPRITSRTQGCGIDRPVSITSVQGIALSQAATLDCPTAQALDDWVREAMLPAVGNRGGGPVQIRVIGHYSCRTRNNQPGARVSEHGRGRAIDIAGYRLANGETVSVLDDYRRGASRSALRQMYRSACGIFRTTLSPDSDRYHQDHFHFDLAQHRNGGTYCR